MTPTKRLTFKHFHVCVGVGGCAHGMQRARARLGHLEAEFETIGGVDVDAGALRSFERLTGARGTLLDLFDADQYVAFHGRKPPADWRPALPEDLQRAAGWQRPNVVFTSTPCKGLSALLAPSKAASVKYQALNRLTLRAIWLTLEAWKDDPPEFILFENVPRIVDRGAHLLEQIVALLQQYGYATNGTAHDCGKLGGLAQTRRRYLLVARHRAKVPAFLYEPPQKRLRAIGEVLGELPLPDDPRMGPMHRSPRLKWETWVRLALIPAGGDWRDLQKLPFHEFAIVPEREWRNGALGVTPWSEASGTVTGRTGPACGAFSVADPRVGKEWGDYRAYGVRRWDQVSATISASAHPGTGIYTVADPRGEGAGERFGNMYRLTRWDTAAQTITGAAGWSNGAVAVADPRRCGKSEGGEYQTAGHYGVQPWDASSRAIVGRTKVDTGPFSVADPRLPGWKPGKTHASKFGVRAWEAPASTVTGTPDVQSGAPSIADPRPGFGHTMRVTPWEGTAGTLTSARSPAYGAAAVADPRPPAPGQRMDAPPIIIAQDGTWHRPITTLECAALQSFPVTDACPWLATESHSQAREWIGNAVPPDAAEAMGTVILESLLGAAMGHTFRITDVPVWVRPTAIAIALPAHAPMEPTA